MFIEAIEVTGLGGLGHLDITLERASKITGPARACVAFQDALALAFAAWDADVLRSLLARWGCTAPVVEGEDLPEGAHWDTSPGLGGLLDPGADGLVTVGVTIILDPPQYGKLRHLAARDPRLVDALAHGARLSVRTGARFSPGLDAMALDPLGFMLGEEGFPIAGAERPAWMTPFLKGLAGRFQRGGLAGSTWGARAASYRATDQRSLRRALAALSDAPAGLGDVVALPDGPAAFFGESLVSVRHLGRAAEHAVGLVGAVYLSGAEILVVEPEAAWVDWLTAQAMADSSVLEQVILMGVPGGAVIG